jgi:hypothetical protein
MVLSLLVVAMFLIGCTPTELSEEEQLELDSELNELSAEELDQVIEDAESEDTTALAGQAYSKYKRIPRVSKSKVLASAYKVKSKRIIMPNMTNYSKIVAEQNKTIMRLNQTLMNYTKLIAIQNATITRLNFSLMNYSTNGTNSS